jgi:hypothetical protein
MAGDPRTARFTYTDDKTGAFTHCAAVTSYGSGINNKSWRHSKRRRLFRPYSKAASCDDGGRIHQSCGGNALPLSPQVQKSSRMSRSLAPNLSGRSPDAEQDRSILRKMGEGATAP